MVMKVIIIVVIVIIIIIIIVKWMSRRGGGACPSIRSHFRCFSLFMQYVVLPIIEDSAVQQVWILQDDHQSTNYV
eukprot:3096009-Karenia_brevis.AAC.1